MKAYIKTLFVATLVWVSAIPFTSAMCGFGSATPPAPTSSCNCGTKQTAVMKWNGTDCQTLCARQGQLQHYLSQGWVQGCCLAARLSKSETALLKVYPNPATDVLHVEFNVTVEGKVALNLLDASGRQLRKVEEAASSGGIFLSLPLDDLAAGIYYLRLDAPGETHVQKFIHSIK